MVQSISGAVGLGGKNRPDDVRTVQELLNKARAASGLPLIKVDGFIGPETIGAIKQLQMSRFGWADGRVDPDGPTLAALNGSDAQATGRVRCGDREMASGNAGGTAPANKMSLVEGAGSAPPLSPREEALQQKTEAAAWLAKALTALQTVRTLMETGLTADAAKLETLVEYQAIKIHFHIQDSPNPIAFLSQLGKTFTLMNITINTADRIFENDWASEDFANADPGGFHRRNNPTNPGKIYFCPKYLKVGALSKVVTIIHEAAHFVETQIDHYASGFPAPNGRALVGTAGEVRPHNYVNLTPDEASKNAASYAGFCIHVAKGQDKRVAITE